ncbi:glycosyltransferase family 2 protein [Acinetobacter baumannii]|uniref:glycosyltransferase family 2 protein n=1 Tax=Acinetobacter baumannii TaxID=470 RepID=UPI000F73BCE6|nr:glycosyltransferase family 2 protein [Acinetobacter baumannii]RSP91829.1 glycosyltransferase family 2 protein [Acinetobacter baumannii]
MSIELTIFTPSYNRAHTLHRVYESLQVQTLQNFEWIIIDDGSIDNTEDVVKDIINISKFPIIYIKQENSGKQAAWNKAVSLAKGEYFCCLDSDDSIYSSVGLERVFKNYIHYLHQDKVIGLRFLAFSNVKNDFHGSKLSDDIIICSWFDDFSNSKNFGERLDILKTKDLKNFLYPVKEGVKFIPEIWFYIKVSNAGFKFAYIPEPLRLFFDDASDNRLSRSSIKKHAIGHYIARSTMLHDIPTWVYIKNIIAWVKTFIRFSQCANILGVSFKKRLKDTNLLYALSSYLLYYTSKSLK